MAKKEFPSDRLDQYIVRFPDGMRDRIKDAAAANNRSMNAEIIARLEDSFAATLDQEVSDAVREMSEKFGRQMGYLEAFANKLGIDIEDIETQGETDD